MFYGLIYGYKYTEKKIPDLSNKVAIVTGGNTGIGYETCLALAKNGAKVYLAARTESRALGAIDRLRKEVPDARVEWLKLDNMDLAKVREAAQEFSKKEGKLDMLFNNAGIMGTPYELTKDGVEGQFQTNHLSHFYLTRLLLPKLEKSSDPRVVNTSSAGHALGKGDYSSLESINQTFNSPWRRYGQSKLANILMTMELSKRYPNINANAVHPGVVATELVRGPGASYGAFAGSAVDLFQKGLAYAGIFLWPNQGALTQLYCGTAIEISKKGISGKYFEPVAQLKAPKTTASEESANTLWETSEKILKDKGFSLTL